MDIPVLSYAVATAAYSLLTVLLLVGREPGGRQGRWLLVATAGTALWGLSIAVAAAFSAGAALLYVTYTADAIRTLLWTMCMLSFLPQASIWRGRLGLSTGAAGLAAVAILAPVLTQRAAGAHLALLGMSIVGCMAVEQIFRNSTIEQARILKTLLWTVTFLFCYDLFLYSDAVLFGVVDGNLWTLRGLLAAIAVPFFLLAAKRHPDWTRTLFVSRQVVFYSATLTGLGIYLIAMAIVAALVRQKGGEWGALVQFMFFAAALGVLGFVLSSARLRALARVFISKHFYRNRYEYRDEWLRLIRTLSDSEPDLPLEHRGIKALAAIIESPGGQLWLQRGSPNRAYEPFAAWQAPFPSQEFSADSVLVRFLHDQRWIIDSGEYERDPERYNHAFLDNPSSLPKGSVIVPLFHQRELLGFVRLVRPERLKALNYEDHDLLKTAGRQVAAFLAHDLAKEQLAETRQFEAYSKLSAFVMHDLKNLLAQQALLVENAKKHQHRPEFVADVVRTVDHGVQRMRRLLQQLQQRSTPSLEQRVELNSTVERAIASCGNARGANIDFVQHTPLWVQAQPDRLSSVIAHVIVNAQEATPQGGTIDISVSEHDGRGVVEVRDSGEGMSEEFVRRRLFKPFETTKGASGMGIGVYQAREVIRSLGGDITVESAVGMGTTVRLVLPIAHPLSEGRQLSGSAG